MKKILIKKTIIFMSLLITLSCQRNGDGGMDSSGGDLTQFDQYSFSDGIKNSKTYLNIYLSRLEYEFKHDPDIQKYHNYEWTKMFTNPQISWKEALDKISIKSRLSSLCPGGKDGSYADNEICISYLPFKKRDSYDDFINKLMPLLAHEFSHALGFDEPSAKKIQQELERKTSFSFDYILSFSQSSERFINFYNSALYAANSVVNMKPIKLCGHLSSALSSGQTFYYDKKNYPIFIWQGGRLIYGEIADLAWDVCNGSKTLSDSNQIEILTKLISIHEKIFSLFKLYQEYYFQGFDPIARAERWIESPSALEHGLYLKALTDQIKIPEISVDQISCEFYSEKDQTSQSLKFNINTSQELTIDAPEGFSSSPLHLYFELNTEPNPSTIGGTKYFIQVSSKGSEFKFLISNEVQYREANIFLGRSENLYLIPTLGPKASITINFYKISLYPLTSEIAPYSNKLECQIN